MIQQAYKYVSLSFWPRLVFFEEFPVELLTCQVEWSALQIGQDTTIYILDLT